jgi:hypothetical protein
MSNYTRPAANVALELPNMTVHGFTGTLILTGESGSEIVTILKQMQAAGMQQAAPTASAASAAPAADSPPMCPIHNKPMKPSRKPGGWYCSAKVGDGYCSETR